MNIITIQKRRNNNYSFPSFQPILRLQVRPCQNMEEVLRIAFRHLPYSLLRRCMLVSKGWRKVALDELQARCFVIISHEDHVHFVLKKLQANSTFRVGKCQITGVGVSLDNFFLHQTFSRVAYSLHQLKLETHVEIHESNLFALLTKLPNITHLSVTFLRAGNRQPSTYNHSDQFPCLGGRRSSIQGAESGDIKSSESSDYCVPVYRNVRHLHLDLGQTFQLTRIFQVFPSLFELAIANVTDEPRKHFKSLQSPLPLKHLMLRQYSSAGFTEKLVQTLMRFSNMSLETLALISHPPTTSSSTQQPAQPSSFQLKQFIESQENSLKSLKLVQVDDDLQCTWNMNSNSALSSNSYYHWNFNYSSSSASSSLLPLRLPLLERLHVQKPLITNLAQVLNHFPKLEQVSIQVSRHGSNWKGLLPARLQPHENIKKLEIDFIDSDSFSWLGYCFPSLQTLQLGFCDKTLFAVLCKLIPYFNSNIASKTLVSCHLCHGISHEFALERGRKGEHQEEDGENKAEQDNNESGNKESLVVTKPTRKDTGVAPPTLDRNSFPGENINSKFPSSAPFHHNESAECHTTSFTGKQVNSPGMIQLEMVQEQGQEKTQKRKYPFKNLKLLRVRPCSHLPFEDFVFLQGHRDSGSTQNQNFFLKNFDAEPLSESPVGFSWTMLSSTMTGDKFEDLSTHSTSDGFDETCSSA